MKHPIYQITGFKKVKPFTLSVSFNDGTRREINFQPILAGKLYEPLRDERIFDKVSLDPEVHTLVWPNGADFDPATLHDWDKREEELKQAAKKWTKKKTPAKRSTRKKIVAA